MSATGRGAGRFCKGDLVMLKSDVNFDKCVPCWRKTTEQEDKDWEDSILNNPLDDAGEPHVRVNAYRTDWLPTGTCAIVLKARCTAQLAYNAISGCAQLLIPFNGNTYHVLRRYIVVGDKDENSIYE